MKSFLGLVLLSILASSSFAGEIKVSAILHFDKESCSVVANELGQSFALVAQQKSLPQDTYVVEHDFFACGHHGGTCFSDTCQIRVHTTDKNHLLVESYGKKFYGKNRNAQCEQNADEIARDASVAGVAVSYNVGFTFRPFCQTWSVKAE